MRAVEARNIIALLIDHPEVSAEKGRNRSKEDAETSHEGKKRLRRVNDLPGLHDPRGGDSGQNDATLDIDVLGK